MMHGPINISVTFILKKIITAVLQAEACNADTTPTQPHRNTNTHRTKNNTNNVVIQQNSRKLLMMDILMSKTCWARMKWNKHSKWHQVGLFFSTITMMYGPINIRYTHICVCVCVILQKILSCWSWFVPMQTDKRTDIQKIIVVCMEPCKRFWKVSIFEGFIKEQQVPVHINSRKSPASGGGNVSKSRPMSQVRTVRAVAGTEVSMLLQWDRWRCHMRLIT